MDRARVFHERLQKLYGLCEGCAMGESVRMASLQPLFSRQPFSAEVEMPVLVMELGRVRVNIRPRPIDERIDGKSFGCVVVDRTLADGGLSGGSVHMDGYSCWTDLNGCDDEGWYLGVAPDTARPVDAATVKMWLQRSGPRPLF
jgi:hypothetical protein